MKPIVFVLLVTLLMLGVSTVTADSHELNVRIDSNGRVTWNEIDGAWYAVFICQTDLDVCMGGYNSANIYTQSDIDGTEWRIGWGYNRRDNWSSYQWNRGLKWVVEVLAIGGPNGTLLGRAIRG